MANEINDINDNTGKIEYKKIFEHLIKNKKFKESVLLKKGNMITIKGFEEMVGEVVGEILEEAKKGKVSPFKYLGYDYTTRMNTVSTLDLEGGSKELLTLKKDLKEKIENMVEGELKLKGLDENQGVTRDITFDYSFNEKEIKCKNVTLNKGDITKVPRLRLDTVEICINKQDLKEKLKLGVRNYCEETIEDEEDLEIELEKIDNECKEIKAIFNVLNDEALGRIRRTISGTYLSYLIKNLAKDDKNKQLLEAYEKRFIRLEEYLKEIIENRSGKHLMSLDGKEINIAEILMKGDAFNSLPLIGDLNISLGESSNEEEKIFKFSIKLKLNGRVQREGTVNTVVEYYKQKVEKKDFHKKYLDEGRIRIIFLYFFLFYRLDEEEYDPVSIWENEMLKCLKKEGIDKLSKIFIVAVRDDGVIAKRIEAMKSSLKKVLIYESSSMQPLKENRTLALSKGILGDVDGGDSLFKEHDYNKQMLKYVSVLINGFSDKYLLSVPIDIKIKSTDIYEDSKASVERSKIKYELAGLESLKVLFVPLSESNKKEEEATMKALEKIEKNNVVLELQYKNEKFREQDRENPEYVLTSMIYLLLSYLIIDLILQKSKKEKKNIYVAMLRFHNLKDEKAIDGEFIRDISKILEHLFNNRYRAGSQGIKKENNSKSYVVNNAMCSLYSKIPKIIEFSRNFELKKMAIVIVTSASCNREKVTGDERHDRVIVGEIVKCVADDSGRV
ncbi:MAG: hypothetical protein ACRC28_02535, partial [Clostridium sp.]|uniref:hypothetical protein n=1 Tax=Clostridium sp. TaxID=1506 RepID=UPI003F3BCB54